MNKYLPLILVLTSLIVQSQTIEMVLIGNPEKAKNVLTEVADLDASFIFEEYCGWYDGIDDYVTQFSIWGVDGMLLKSVFLIEKIANYLPSKYY